MTELAGRWIESGGRVQADAVCGRIERLTAGADGEAFETLDDAEREFERLGCTLLSSRASNLAELIRREGENTKGFHA